MSKNTTSRRSFLRSSSLLGLTTGVSVNTAGLFSLLNSPSAHANDDDYKAIVYIFLNGGNDAFNTLVPKDDGQLRADYEKGRAHIALPADDLHELTLKAPAKIYGGENYNSFGLHPACADMATMFNDEEMSIICNVGTLATPTTKAQYNDDNHELPPQLFSHSDQQRQYQSSPSAAFDYGWGGRLSEYLTSHNNNGFVSPLLSVSGLNTFQVTRDSLISTYVMGNDGPTNLRSYNGLRKTMMEGANDNVDENAHFMVKKFRDVFTSAQSAKQVVGDAFAEAEAKGVDYDAIFEASGDGENVFSRRLKTVAKMIAGKNSTGNKRPIYFVKFSGFDNHKNVLEDHNELMISLNAALKGFRDALKAQGDFDNTLTFVGSEFGRTFAPNGNGTDHAWGGHAFLMGGMINGGQLFGIHPDCKISQDLDVDNGGRGRWIPTTSTVQCSAVIANWFGVDKQNLNDIFPHLVNFPNTFEAEDNLQFFKSGDAS